MKDFEKIAEISRLLSEIEWPENADVYFTTGHYFMREDPHVTISVYVSEFNEYKTCHKKDTFGKHFRIIHSDLDDCIKQLLKRKGK